MLVNLACHRANREKNLRKPFLINTNFGKLWICDLRRTRDRAHNAYLHVFHGEPPESSAFL